MQNGVDRLTGPFNGFPTLFGQFVGECVELYVRVRVADTGDLLEVMCWIVRLRNSDVDRCT